MSGIMFINDNQPIRMRNAVKLAYKCLPSLGQNMVEYANAEGNIEAAVRIRQHGPVICRVLNGWISFLCLLNASRGDINAAYVADERRQERMIVTNPASDVEHA